MEIILTYLLDRQGGKATFGDLYSITRIPKRTLKKFLWYCQRRKLMRREIGIYYITDEGRDFIKSVPIISIGEKIFITAADDQVHMVTLGRKMRIREFENEFLKKLVLQKCIKREEIRNSNNRRQLMSAIRLFRLLKMARYRGDSICIEPNSEILRTLGIF